MTPRFDRYKHQPRLFALFPTSDDTKSSVEAMDWYKSIKDYQCRRAFIMEYEIKTLYKKQQDLINVLTKAEKFLIVEEWQLTRPCRVAAMVMQICVNVAAMKVKTPPIAVTEDEYENGVFCRPYLLMIFPDEDINPGILMDAATLAHYTHVEWSTPNISVTFPGDETLHLANSDVIYCSMTRLKQLIGQNAVDLSGVQRIIVDEPLYFDEAGFEEFGMLLRHHKLNPKVDVAFVGRSYTAFTKKKIKDITDQNLPSLCPHTVESRQVSKAEWDAYGNSL